MNDDCFINKFNMIYFKNILVFLILFIIICDAYSNTTLSRKTRKVVFRKNSKFFVSLSFINNYTGFKFNKHTFSDNSKFYSQFYLVLFSRVADISFKLMYLKRRILCFVTSFIYYTETSKFFISAELFKF